MSAAAGRRPLRQVRRRRGTIGVPHASEIPMSEPALHDYLVISRGQWDADATPDRVQGAIDAFYSWLDGHIAAGRMRTGSRLKAEGATVTRNGIVTDGPFGETKELIGGYWLVAAASLEEAARLLADSPTVALGLFYEVRPLDPQQATATMRATETTGRG